MRYLSAEWFDAAGDALADDDALATALAGVDLTIEQTVVPGVAVDDTSTSAADEPPGGSITWHVTIADGKVALDVGPAPRADVRFTTGWTTAVAIATGALPAQRAFIEGRLRVGGDLSSLIAHQRALAAVDDTLAPLRARTTYG